MRVSGTFFLSMTVCLLPASEPFAIPTFAVFAVSLSGATAKTVKVDYLPTGGQGTELVPFGGTLTFAPGETSKNITVSVLGDTRFELLQWLEAAPDQAWDRQLDWLILQARQHELEHLAAIWRVALYWDRVSPASVTGLPLHPADRLEESH